MDDSFWWDTNSDDGFANLMLKFSVECRKWYLKTDVKVRLKNILFKKADFDEFIYIWKRLRIVKYDFGEEVGSQIIQEAIKELQEEINDPEIKKSVQRIIKRVRKTLNEKHVKLL